MLPRVPLLPSPRSRLQGQLADCCCVARRTWEEVQGDKGAVVRVSDERVQPALLQVPHRHHARAAARRHQRHTRACAAG